MLEVVPGPAGVANLLAALPAALAGDGPALGVVPAGHDTAAERARAAVVGRGHGTDPDVAVVLATSGSTGRPRGVLLPGAALLASAHAAYARLGGPGAWTLAIPVTGAGGLQVLVRSLVSGRDPVVLASVGGAERFTARAFAEATAALDDDLPAYTSLVPTQVARLLDDPAGRDALRAYAAVLLGGARTPPVLLARLREAGVAAVTTYGMTETSGGMFYDGTALPGVGASIVDPDPDGVGRIALWGPTLARGYLDEPALTEAAFAEGRLLTGDVGRLGADGVLEVLGRVDDVVQVGGVNVAVSAVADVLAEVCADACVLAAPDDTWGSTLTAYLAPRADGTTPDDDGLARRVAGALGRAAVPRAWVRLDSLPHLPNGKPDREALRAMTGASREAPAAGD
ncbi:MAG: AMP-binding protein [Frankiales bacterium]|nr:AMP-binding protein [Frankiales bacterium]